MRGCCGIALFCLSMVLSGCQSNNDGPWYDATGRGRGQATWDMDSGRCHTYADGNTQSPDGSNYSGLSNAGKGLTAAGDILQAIAADAQRMASYRNCLNAAGWTLNAPRIAAREPSIPQPEMTQQPQQQPSPQLSPEQLGDQAYNQKNYAEALKFYLKGDVRGNGNLQNRIGTMYQNGFGVTQDYAHAVEWYRRSAYVGSSDGQTNLGRMYLNGNGVQKDSREAIIWLLKAADQGNTFAQNDLGFVYLNGHGATADYTLAMKMFLASAAKGNGVAQYNIGVMYMKALGVPKDYVQAYKWFTLSLKSLPAEDDPSRAIVHRDRDFIATNMSALQIADAQRLAQDWNPA